MVTQAASLRAATRNSASKIHINDFSYDVFRCVLHWIYTDTLSLSAEDRGTTDLVNSRAFSVWSAATFFCLPNLAMCVENHISTMLTPENVSTFWNHVNKIDSANLQRICETYFLENLEKVIKTDNFLKLEKDLVVRVFYSNPRPSFSDNFVNSLKKIPTALSVSAVTQWLTVNSPEFSKTNIANTLAKNRPKTSASMAMELQ